MQEVYVIAGGDWYRHVLNAVAAFMQTENWKIIERMLYRFFRFDRGRELD